MNQTLSYDGEIRNVLLSRLLEIHTSDAWLFNELGLEWGSAIFDMAAIDEAIHGYEIKSDRDSLSRLPNQVRLFSQVADYMTLVVGQKHIVKAMELIPDWWGVILAKKADESITLLSIREPLRNEKQCAVSLARLMWKSEIESMLRSSKNYAPVRGRDKEKCAAHLASVTSIDLIRIEAIKNVKSRKRERRLIPTAAASLAVKGE